MAMAEQWKYLYCIIPCNENRNFDVSAIGNAEGTVYTICYENLAVVVSDSPVAKYETGRKNMIAHETVLERVMEEFTLLPIRFGTVTESGSSEEDILKLLRSRYREFANLLKEMENKIELGLKALWRDEKAIFDEILTESAEIRKLRNSLSRKPASVVHYDGIDLGRKVKEALDSKRSQEAAKILTPLRRLAERVRENELLVDRVVLNAAFLVNKERGPEFDLMVGELDKNNEGRILFKYVGPVPPYNFVNIEVNWRELE